MGKDCKNCGTVLEDTALTCYACGTQQLVSDSSATITQESTPTNSVRQSIARFWADATPKKRKKVLLICGASLIIAVIIILALAGASTNREPPFFGIERGDSVEAVEKRLGKPDDFEDNGLRNFNYYYDVEFLNIDGYTKFHFELDKVDMLYFYNYGTASVNDYEDIVEYYTQKYGEPEQTSDNYASSGKCMAFWLLDNNTILQVQYTLGNLFSKSCVQIAVYS